MIGKNNNSKRTSIRSYTKLVNLILVLGVLIFVTSGGLWWLKIRNNPENLFNAMLNNNLRTASVTRTTIQDNGQSQLEQVIRIQNRTQHVTHGTTTLTQGGGSTIIVTESVGTPDVEFIKYNSITTSQKSSIGKEIDFSEVMNVWGENKPQQDDQLSELYQDATIGNLFVFADLDASTRSNIMSEIKNTKVYEVDYNNTLSEFVGGRQKISYQVKLNPKPYIQMIKDYGQAIGLTQFDNLNPDDYENAEPIPFEVKIDVLSQRIDRTSSGDGSSSQIFNGYGIIENIEIPKDFIPADELQKRLTEKASA